MRGIVLGLVLLVAALPRPAPGASFDVRLVDGYRVISVEGVLENGDQGRFAAAAAGARETVVSFRSLGGNLMAGIEIGKLIRLRGFFTVVGADQYCVSACALAWLGGRERYLADDAIVAFHAAFRDDGGTLRETGLGNALVGAYLTNLGLGEEAVAYLTYADPTSLARLDDTIAAQIGIDVHVLATPASVARDLRERAEAFLRAHWQQIGSDNERYLAYARRVYQGTVDYFGKPTAAVEILRQQASYVARWPRRASTSEAAEIVCDEAVRSCTISGSGRFEAESAARNKQSAGSFAYSFTVSFRGDQPRIVRESSTVTARTQRDLATALPVEATR